MIKKLKSKKGKALYGLRMHTVEPVFGSLQQYYGLRWMNVRGKNNANKVMLMSAAAFNLKKWVKKLIKDTENGLNILILMMSATITRYRAEKFKFTNFSIMSLCGECQYVRCV